MRFLIGCIIGFLVMYFKEGFDRYFLKQRAIERKFAIFNEQRNSFEWTNKDAMYVIDGAEEIKKKVGKAKVFTMNRKRR